MHDALHNDVVNRAGQVNVGRNIQSRDKTKFPAPANDHPPQHRHQHHYYYCNMMMSIYPVNVVFMISFSLPHHHATCYRHPLLLQNRHFFVYFLFTFCWQVKKKWRGEREGKKKRGRSFDWRACGCLNIPSLWGSLFASTEKKVSSLGLFHPPTPVGYSIPLPFVCCVSRPCNHAADVWDFSIFWVLLVWPRSPLFAVARR